MCICMHTDKKTIYMHIHADLYTSRIESYMSKLEEIAFQRRNKDGIYIFLKSIYICAQVHVYYTSRIESYMYEYTCTCAHLYMDFRNMYIPSLFLR